MKKNMVLPVFIFLLLVVSLACSTTSPTPTVDIYATATTYAENIAQTQVAMEATSAALAEAMTEAADTPTPEPTNTPIPTPTATPGPLVINDDFSQDVGRWVECEKCVIADGVLTMGPYPAVDSEEGYTAICKDCGYVEEYKMGVDATYISGASDRGFGLMIWEDQGYYIDLEITTWQVYGMLFYNKKDGFWYFANDEMDKFLPSSSLRAGRLTNRIDVEVNLKEKSVIIRINSKIIKSVVLKGNPGPGRVGLVVGLHSLGVSFDNFYFEGVPVTLPGSPGDNG